MLKKKGDILAIPFADGLVMDYVENRFVIVIKDELWCDHECQALFHQPLHIYFLYERICAIFLVENVDSIDTSDVSFDIHECGEAKALLQQERYDIEIYLIDAAQTVCAARVLSLSKEQSAIIREQLQKQYDTPYDEAGFDRALQKIQGAYEPFEMESMALFKAVFSPQKSAETKGHRQN